MRQWLRTPGLSNELRRIDTLCADAWWRPGWRLIRLLIVVFALGGMFCAPSAVFGALAFLIMSATSRWPLVMAIMSCTYAIAVVVGGMGLVVMLARSPERHHAENLCLTAGVLFSALVVAIIVSKAVY